MNMKAFNTYRFISILSTEPTLMIMSDIIFLDIFIPKRDGMSVLREIKRDKDIQDIPVIILTNNISQELMSKAYKLGASGYICKSFDFASFKENITDCIKYWTKAVTLPSRNR